MKWIKPREQPPRIHKNQRTSEGDFNKQRQCNCEGTRFRVFMGKRPRRTDRAGILIECIKCRKTQWILADGTVRGTLRDLGAALNKLSNSEAPLLLAERTAFSASVFLQTRLINPDTTI